MAAGMAFEPLLFGGSLVNASKLPRGCRPNPAQLPELKNGVITFDQSGERVRYQSSSISRARALASVSQKLLANSSFDSVVGPAEDSFIQWSVGALGLPC